MRKLLIAVFVLFLASNFAVAQTTSDAPRAELFGGYSYLRGDGDGAHGFNADFTGYLNEWFGITGAVSGHYSSEGFSEGGLNVSADTSLHTFAAGPRVRFNLEDSPITPFAHALFGAARTSFDIDSNIGLPIDIGTSDTNFAMIFGGGVDFKLNDTFSVRAGQFDLVSTRISAGDQTAWDNNFRYSGGIVIRF